MGIYRTTDPTQFGLVDGIIIDESAPPPNISGIQTNIALLVGTFERGPTNVIGTPSSTADLIEQYGASLSYQGLRELQNKRFGALRIVRVKPASSALATKNFQNATPVDAIQFDAKQDVGVYGNNITVKIESGSVSGKKYTIHDGNPGKVLQDEVYDNVHIAVASEIAAMNAASKLIVATVLLNTSEPANIVATNLTGGSDGTLADTDYQVGINTVAEAEGSANFVWADKYSATIRGYLKTHAADVQADMVVLGPNDENVSKSGVITDVATYRDVDGRIIYAFNSPLTNIQGVNVYTSPASWYVSVLSQTAPNIDPAFAGNSQFLGGIVGLKLSLGRQDYIDLVNAGVSAFEFDSDIGFKIKSGVVTQIADSSKRMVFRRRMADYLTSSAAKFMKNYQNAPNTLENRDAVQAAILSFVGTQEKLKILPKDSEVDNGKAKLVDTKSLNSNLTIGQGFFYIKWMQRIFSSMRYIVIVAQIGETVVVTEQS